jgi:hypothetical protein
MSVDVSLTKLKRVAIAISGPLLISIFWIVSQNRPGAVHDMSDLRNLLVVPFLLIGLLVSLIIGLLMAIPLRDQPRATYFGAGISTTLFLLLLFVSTRL